MRDSFSGARPSRTLTTSGVIGPPAPTFGTLGTTTTNILPGSVAVTGQPGVITTTTGQPGFTTVRQGTPGRLMGSTIQPGVVTTVGGPGRVVSTTAQPGVVINQGTPGRVITTGVTGVAQPGIVTTIPGATTQVVMQGRQGTPERLRASSIGLGATTITTGVVAPGTATNGGIVREVRQLEPRLIGLRQSSLPSQVVGTREGQQRFVEERVTGSRVIGVTEQRLQERVIASQIPQPKTYVKQTEIIEEEPVIKEVIVEKPVEVIVEKKVPVNKYVDVPYDVVVERPIEKIIEKEIEIEKIVEKEIQKIVEVPVEKIVEVPVEKIVEVPVPFETRVEVPYERIVEKRVEDIIENIVYHDKHLDVDVRSLHKFPNAEILPTEVRTMEQDRIVERPVYIDNIIERIIDVPIEKIVEVPIEKIVEHPVERLVEKPVYIDKIIEREVQIPIEKIVEQPVERIVEKPVYIDNIIEKPVPIEVIKEQVVEQPVEHIVERPVYVDNIIEKYIDRIIENPVPVEKTIEIPIANYVDIAMPVEKVVPHPHTYMVDRPVAKELIKRVPVEYRVSTVNPVPVENVVEIQVPSMIQQTHERVINKEVLVERIMENPVMVEKIKEVEVPREIERPVYRTEIIEKPIVYDQVIEEKYEVLVPNYIEVPVEKQIVVPKRIIDQQPIEQENIFERDFAVDALVEVPVQGRTYEDDYTVDDPDLMNRIVNNRNQERHLASENQALKMDLNRIRGELNGGFGGRYNRVVADNAHMKAELHELQSRVNIVEKDKHRLRGELSNKQILNVPVLVPDPHLGNLKRELEGLINENNSLIRRVRTTADHL